MADGDRRKQAVDELVNAIDACTGAWGEQFGRPPTANELVYAWSTVISAAADRLTSDPATLEALRRRRLASIPVPAVDDLTIDFNVAAYYGLERATVRTANHSTFVDASFELSDGTLLVDYALGYPFSEIDAARAVAVKALIDRVAPAYIARSGNTAAKGVLRAYFCTEPVVEFTLA